MIAGYNIWYHTIFDTRLLKNSCRDYKKNYHDIKQSFLLSTFFNDYFKSTSALKNDKLSFKFIWPGTNRDVTNLFSEVKNILYASDMSW